MNKTKTIHPSQTEQVVDDDSSYSSCLGLKTNTATTRSEALNGDKLDGTILF
jgi:hypothetical protein